MKEKSLLQIEKEICTLNKLRVQESEIKVSKTHLEDVWYFQQTIIYNGRKKYMDTLVEAKSRKEAEQYANSFHYYQRYNILSDKLKNHEQHKSKNPKT